MSTLFVEIYLFWFTQVCIFTFDFLFLQIHDTIVNWLSGNIREVRQPPKSVRGTLC